MLLLCWQEGQRTSGDEVDVVDDDGDDDDDDDDGEDDGNQHNNYN